ncbi:LysR family transcriptional regulator [Vibrio mediterranei]
MIGHNYKLLRPLQALLETRSLTEAAERLRVTQSAMSRNLTQLRAEFSDPLLIREGKTFVLTARGESLKRALPHVLSAIEGLYADCSIEPSEIKRIYRIAYSSFSSLSLVKDLSLALMSQAPNASFSMELWQHRDIDELSTTDVDVLITPAHRIPDNIYGKRIADNDYVVVRSKEHHKAQQTLCLERYLESRHVLLHLVANIDLEVNEFFANLSVKRNVALTLSSAREALDVVRESDLLVTLPKYLVEKLPDKADFDIHPLPFSLPSHSYYLLWHAKWQNDVAHRWLRDTVFSLL